MKWASNRTKIGKLVRSHATYALCIEPHTIVWYRITHSHWAAGFIRTNNWTPHVLGSAGKTYPFPQKERLGTLRLIVIVMTQYFNHRLFVLLLIPCQSRLLQAGVRVISNQRRRAFDLSVHVHGQHPTTPASSSSQTPGLPPAMSLVD